MRGAVKSPRVCTTQKKNTACGESPSSPSWLRRGFFAMSLGRRRDGNRGALDADMVDGSLLQPACSLRRQAVEGAEPMVVLHPRRVRTPHNARRLAENAWPDDDASLRPGQWMNGAWIFPDRHAVAVPAVPVNGQQRIAFIQI